MQVSDILTPQQVRCGVDALSKKRTLELLSAMIAARDPSLTVNAVFDCLLARERLGSTGLEEGVAIPHGRMRGITRAIGAFMRLNQGVDFDAQDRQPVDLVFGLLVPEDATDEHLQILSQLAEMLSDPSLREQLRTAESEQSIFDLLAPSVHQS
ncbi:MAG: PTS IIA-like nitrogen regulatory protein PtsN [Gammaproteobacteria bacterium]|nr:PTS IIA-like nitrogen regulatory protein PtsN [Gammaproteobacteria bacterium]